MFQSLFYTFQTIAVLYLYILAERQTLSCPSVRSFYCANACDYFIKFVCI